LQGVLNNPPFDQNKVYKQIEDIIDLAMDINEDRAEAEALLAATGGRPGRGMTYSDEWINGGNLFDRLIVPPGQEAYFKRIMTTVLDRKFGDRSYDSEVEQRENIGEIQTTELDVIAERERKLCGYNEAIAIHRQYNNTEELREEERKRSELLRANEDDSRDMFQDSVIPGMRARAVKQVIYGLRQEPVVTKPAFASNDPAYQTPVTTRETLTSPSAGGSITSREDAIKIVQTQLRALNNGLYEGPIDGQSNAKMEWALQRYLGYMQSWSKNNDGSYTGTIDGIYGDETLDMFERNERDSFYKEGRAMLDALDYLHENGGVPRKASPAKKVKEPVGTAADDAKETIKNAPETEPPAAEATVPASKPKVAIDAVFDSLFANGKRSTGTDILNAFGKAFDPNYDPSVANPVLETFMLANNIKTGDSFGIEDKDAITKLMQAAYIYRDAKGDVGAMKKITEDINAKSPTQVGRMNVIQKLVDDNAKRLTAAATPDTTPTDSPADTAKADGTMDALLVKGEKVNAKDLLNILTQNTFAENKIKDQYDPDTMLPVMVDFLKKNYDVDITQDISVADKDKLKGIYKTVSIFMSTGGDPALMQKLLDGAKDGSQPDFKKALDQSDQMVDSLIAKAEAILAQKQAPGSNKQDSSGYKPDYMQPIMGTLSSAAVGLYATKYFSDEARLNREIKSYAKAKAALDSQEIGLNKGPAPTPPPPARDAPVAGTAQDVGRKYEDGKGGFIQHDAISAGTIDKPLNATEAKDYLRGIIKDASDTADRVLADAGNIKDWGGSTVSGAIVTPDGHIAHAHIGDSPIIAYVVDAQGNVTGTHVLNTLHNPDPYATHLIGENSGKESYQNLVADKTGKFEGTVKISDLTKNKGDRIILVAASDGVLDKVGDAPRTMTNVEEARKYIVGQVQKVAESYAPHIEAQLKKGGDASDIARSIVNGSQKYDNTSVAATIIDPENLPKNPVALLAADGNYMNGKIVSSAIKDSFHRHVSTHIPNETLRPVEAADATARPKDFEQRKKALEKQKSKIDGLIETVSQKKANSWWGAEKNLKSDQAAWRTRDLNLNDRLATAIFRKDGEPLSEKDFGKKERELLRERAQLDVEKELLDRREEALKAKKSKNSRYDTGTPDDTGKTPVNDVGVADVKDGSVTDEPNKNAPEAKNAPDADTKPVDTNTTPGDDDKKITPGEENAKSDKGRQASATDPDTVKKPEAIDKGNAGSSYKDLTAQKDILEKDYKNITESIEAQEKEIKKLEKFHQDAVDPQARRDYLHGLEEAQEKLIEDKAKAKETYKKITENYSDLIEKQKEIKDLTDLRDKANDAQTTREYNKKIAEAESGTRQDSNKSVDDKTAQNPAVDDTPVQDAPVDDAADVKDAADQVDDAADAKDAADKTKDAADVKDAADKADDTVDAVENAKDTADVKDAANKVDDAADAANNADNAVKPVEKASKLGKLIKVVGIGLPLIGAYFYSRDVDAKEKAMDKNTTLTQAQRDAIRLYHKGGLAQATFDPTLVIGASAAQGAKESFIKKYGEEVRPYLAQTDAEAFAELLGGGDQLERRHKIEDIVDAYVEANGVPPAGHPYYKLAKALQEVDDTRWTLDFNRAEAARDARDAAADALLAKVDSAAKADNNADDKNYTPAAPSDTDASGATAVVPKGLNGVDATTPFNTASSSPSPSVETSGGPSVTKKPDAGLKKNV
ncbi:MAG: hypothetical protein WBK77_03425, partial [Alphaproteobacteria bacterium]